VLRSTQPSTLRETGNVVAYELRGEGLVWLIGAMVCLGAAPRVQFFASAGNGFIMRRGIISYANQLPLPRL